MRILVISDIHGNLAAFDAVLNNSRGDWDQVYCLGDMTGYGPDPGECIKKAAECSSVILGGNHDLAASGVLTLEDFADHARRAIEWTRPRLSSADRAYLGQLSLTGTAGGIFLSHGSPADPLWGYIFSTREAAPAFAAFTEKICFFGHTHLPSYFIERRTGPDPFYESGYGRNGLSINTRESGDYPGKTGMNRRYLLNPGSAGFPRDEEDAHRPKRFGGATARYALFDTETGIWQFRRAVYDFRDTAARMKKHRLW
ncbi:MAG: metallophosphatase family protein [Spirochaetaceae bacterium]|jgi:predicted phosphodiesterase|nr:metallophosphatase family protein [Spirochaetaceae bacterium]